jgi:hypothetical protein
LSATPKEVTVFVLYSLWCAKVTLFLSAAKKFSDKIKKLCCLKRFYSNFADNKSANQTKTIYEQQKVFLCR